jgi:uncharacterized protein (TIGR03435 family)
MVIAFAAAVTVLRKMRAVASIFIIILIATTMSVARAQTPAANLSYEVSSIKPNNSGPGDSSGDFGPHVRATNYTLKSLILLAYSIPEFQLIGGPDWIGTLRFDIEATTGDGVRPIDREQIFSLLRSLLEDRFQLKVHRETREEAVFNLVVGKNGSKLKETAEQDAHGSGGMHGGPDTAEMTGTGNSIEDLVRRLAAQVGRPVIDKTNLTGRFDFKLTFNPRTLVSADSSIQSAAPDIFTALQEQLGLKLESAKGPVEVLVIDSVSKPSEN